MRLKKFLSRMRSILVEILTFCVVAAYALTLVSYVGILAVAGVQDFNWILANTIVGRTMMATLYILACINAVWSLVWLVRETISENRRMRGLPDRAEQEAFLQDQVRNLLPPDEEDTIRS